MRRRLGILLVLTLSATLTACFGEDADPLPAKVTAFLDQEVSDDPGPVVERVRAVSGVNDIVVTTKDEAFALLKEQMKDRPDLLAKVSPDSLPASVSVTVPDGSVAEVVELVIGALDGVDGTSLAIAGGSVRSQEYTGVIIRLTTTASDNERNAVEAMVRRLPGTDDISFETAEQARDRLRKRCDDRDQLATAFDAVALEHIPASVRFRLDVDRAKGSGLDPTRRLDGVEEMLFVPVETV